MACMHSEAGSQAQPLIVSPGARRSQLRRIWYSRGGCGLPLFPAGLGAGGGGCFVSAQAFVPALLRPRPLSYEPQGSAPLRALPSRLQPQALAGPLLDDCEGKSVPDTELSEVWCPLVIYAGLFP